MKRLLVRHGVRVDKTHDIGALLAQADPVAPGLAQTLRKAEELTAHAVASRYPGQEPPLNRAEARERLGVSRQVLTRVRARLQTYLDAGRPTGS